MAINTIDAVLIQRMFIAGANNLQANKEHINDLNVFPVPDGDTGTNMTMTIMAAAKDVVAIQDPTVKTVTKAISSGSLRGARGNSGVILSQLFRGFCKELNNVETIDTVALARACGKAVETAYKAVMKPKEGTILTVAKGISDKAQQLSIETDDVLEFTKGIIEEGEAVLLQTPEMLPVLKEAGVVDSGGQGLIEVLKGCLGVLTGEITDYSLNSDVPAKAEGSSNSFTGSAMENVDIKFGYCTEFIVMLEKSFTAKDEAEFKAYLESIGDSIVCVPDDEIVKIHVHTNDPGLAIQKGLSYGSLTSMKIDNMREEHNERVIMKQELEKAAETVEITPVEEKEHKQYGIVAISAGSGLAEIFEALGADEIIQGGQTMNPSTEDIMNAVDRINADVIYVLPNNKNIILAAQQTASIVEDKKVVVIPTKTIPQGITAIVNFEMNKTPEENENDMCESISTVKSGQLTYAVRDTSIDGIEIKCDDIMGISDKGIIAVSQTISDTFKSMLEQMVDDESSLISIYFGEEIKEDDAVALRDEVASIYPDCEVEVQYGGQPVYYYIVSVE